MIKLERNDIYRMDRTSSKGNQTKWRNGDIWYKSDYLGYEGLSEYVVSKLLEKSNLRKDEFVIYDLETIVYDDRVMKGCKSENFLETGKNLFTLQRLYMQITQKDLYKSIFKITEVNQRIQFLVNEIEKTTGIEGFGVYLSKLITIDAFFLNEDRHMHNIAIISDSDNNYELCPIFDNGACLLSDYRGDYPLESDIYKLIEKVKPKTFSFYSFDEQLEEIEKLYGCNIQFYFTKNDIDSILDSIPNESYSISIKERVRKILYTQCDKYQYLFK